ncbi:MAG: crossover junction endodeoxyribonuclease RuvC [Desulfobacterales bacterium]|nr:crossover junction endodeoxyribonuclease RuvC [Desulfobacterales bacterium]
MAKIIGIDPGLAATGIGIVTGTGFEIKSFHYGSISTSQNHSMPARLNKIFSDLMEVLEKEKPDLMIVEDTFYLKEYPKSGLTLGKVTGIILLASFKNNVPVFEIPVKEAKHALTGNGNASKAQLEETVRHILNVKEQLKPYHASDALALSIIGLYRYDSLS